MPGELVAARRMRPWRTIDPVSPDEFDSNRRTTRHTISVVDQAKPDLATTGQFDIELGKQFGVEQGPMLGAMAARRSANCVAQARRWASRS